MHLIREGGEAEGPGLEPGQGGGDRRAGVRNQGREVPRNRDSWEEVVRAAVASGKVYNGPSLFQCSLATCLRNAQSI